MKACEGVGAWADLAMREARDILAHLRGTWLIEKSLAVVEVEEGGLASSCSRHQINAAPLSSSDASSEVRLTLVCAFPQAGQDHQLHARSSSTLDEDVWDISTYTRSLFHFLVCHRHSQSPSQQPMGQSNFFRQTKHQDAMADQTLAAKYYEQLKAAQATIFDLECRLETKRHGTQDNDTDGMLILELERQAAALNGQNQELIEQVNALKQESETYAGKLQDAERELRVCRNQAQAKEKEMAAQTVKLMEQGAQHGVDSASVAQEPENRPHKESAFDSMQPQSANNANSEPVADCEMEDVSIDEAASRRPARASAKKAREQFVYRGGYESDDSEDLPIKAEPRAAKITAQKRKQPDYGSDYSTSLGNMQKMSLNGVHSRTEKQRKIAMPVTKQRNHPPGSATKKTAASARKIELIPVKPIHKARRQNLPPPANLASKSVPRRSLNEITDFTFKMITEYTNRSKTDFSGYQSLELESNMSDFWDILRPLVDTWENRAGAEWTFDIERATISKKCRVCVSSKLEKRTTVWREGDAGHFACKDCVSRGKPCFTWAGEDEGYHCLPVHEADKRKSVVFGREIWHWINEGDESGGEDNGRMVM